MFDCLLNLFLQMLCKKCHGAVPCVSGVIRAIPHFVIWVFKGVASLRIDVGFNTLAYSLHLFFELLYRRWRDAAVLAAKQAEDWRVNFLEITRIISQGTVVDHIGCQRWLF